MKYYYDDPLAAAWMAKHFGMKFTDNGDPLRHTNCVEGFYGSQGGSRAEVISLGWVPERDARCGFRIPAKLYIHPDSLKLLEPQLYDDYDMGSDGGIVRIITPEEYKVVARESPSIVEKYMAIEMLCDEASECLRQSWLPIRRNGIPFMWPKTED